MRKKIFKVLLCGVLILGITGCGSSTQKENNSNEFDTGKTDTTYYETGTAIYFNPETAKICKESDAVSTTGTKTGCMKWYTFNDSENETKISMILDHNTTISTTWTDVKICGKNEEATTAKDALESDTKTWSKKLEVRLISADEIAKIVNAKNWNSETASYVHDFYFETGNDSDPTLEKGQATYKWLYNYTANCENYGCDSADEDVIGYWTSTQIMYEGDCSWHAWKVWGHGKIVNEFKTDDDAGIRPVITISKSLLK